MQKETVQSKDIQKQTENKDSTGVPEITQLNPFDLARKKEGHKLTVAEATKILGIVDVVKVKQILMKDGYDSKDITKPVMIEYIRSNLDKVIPKKSKANVFEKYIPIKELTIQTIDGLPLTVQIQKNSYKNTIGVEMLKLPLICSKSWQIKLETFNGKIIQKYSTEIAEKGEKGIGFKRHEVVCTEMQYAFVEQFYTTCNASNIKQCNFKLAFCGYDINANFTQNDYYDVLMLLRHLSTDYSGKQSIKFFQKKIPEGVSRYIERNKDLIKENAQMHKDLEDGGSYVLPAFLAPFIPDDLQNVLCDHYGYAMIFNNLMKNQDCIQMIDNHLDEVMGFITNANWTDYKIDKFGIDKEIQLIWFIAQCVWLFYGIILLPMPDDESLETDWSYLIQSLLPEHVNYSLMKLGCSMVHSIVHNDVKGAVQTYACCKQVKDCISSLHTKMQSIRTTLKGGQKEFNHMWNVLKKTPTFAYRPITWDSTRFTPRSLMTVVQGDNADNLVARYPHLFTKLLTSNSEDVDIIVVDKKKQKEENKKRRKERKDTQKVIDFEKRDVAQQIDSQSHKNEDKFVLGGFDIKQLWDEGVQKKYAVQGGDLDYFKKHFAPLGSWNLSPEVMEGFDVFYKQKRVEKPQARFRDIFYWYYHVPLNANIPVLIALLINEEGKWSHFSWIKDFQRHVINSLKDKSKKVQEDHNDKLTMMQAQLKPGKMMDLKKKAIKKIQKDKKGTTLGETLKDVVSKLNSKSKETEQAVLAEDNVAVTRSKSVGSKPDTGADSKKKLVNDVSIDPAKIMKGMMEYLIKMGYMSSQPQPIPYQTQDTFFDLIDVSDELVPDEGYIFGLGDISSPCDSIGHMSTQSGVGFKESDDQFMDIEEINEPDLQVDDPSNEDEGYGLVLPSEFFEHLKQRRGLLLEKEENKEKLTDSEKEELKQVKELMENPWYHKFQTLTNQQLQERKQQSMMDKLGQGLDQRNVYNDVASGLVGGKQLRFEKRKFNEMYIRLQQPVVPEEQLIKLQTPFPDLVQFYNTLIKSLQTEAYWIKVGKGDAYKAISKKFLKKIKMLSTKFIWGSPAKYAKAKINSGGQRINELKKIAPEKRSQKQKQELKRLQDQQVVIPDVFTAVKLRNCNFNNYDDGISEYVTLYVQVPDSFKFTEDDALPSFISMYYGPRGKAPNIEVLNEEIKVDPVMQVDPSTQIVQRKILANWYSFINPNFWFPDMDQFKDSELFDNVKKTIDSLEDKKEKIEAWTQFNKSYYLQDGHIQAKNHVSRALYVPRNRMNESGFVVNGRTLTMFMYGADILTACMGPEFINQTKIPEQLENAYTIAQTARVSAGTPQGQIARLMDCYYQHFVMKTFQGDHPYHYLSISQQVAPIYFKDLTNFDNMGLIWNKFSVPADMSTGPIFGDKKRDYGTFLNELLIAKQFLIAIKNGFKFNKERLFISYMKPKEELVPVRKFLKKWRNVFGGNTCFQLPLQLMLNADKGQFFHTFYQPNESEPIWIILGMDQQVSLRKILHQTFINASKFKGDQWFIYSDNVYLYNTDSKLLAAIDGSKMESQVNTGVLKAVFKDIKDGLKARVEKKDFVLLDDEAVLAMQCWLTSKVTYSDYIAYRANMIKQGKEFIDIRQYIKGKYSVDGVSHQDSEDYDGQYYAHINDEYKYLTINAFPTYLNYANAFEFFGMLPLSIEWGATPRQDTFCCKWRLLQDKQSHAQARLKLNLLNINKQLADRKMAISNETLLALLKDAPSLNLVANASRNQITKGEEIEEQEEPEIDDNLKYETLKQIFKAKFNQDYIEVEEDSIVPGDSIQIEEFIPNSDSLCEKYISYFEDYVDHSTAIFGTNIIPIPFLPSGTQFTVQANTVISYNFAVDVYRNLKMPMQEVLKRLDKTDDLDGVALANKQISKYAIMKLEGVAKLDLAQLYSGRLNVIETQFLGINVVSYPLPHMELRASSLDPGMLFYGDKNKEGQKEQQVTSQLLSYMFQGAVWDLGRMCVILYNFAKGQKITQLSVAKMCDEFEIEDMRYASNASFLPSFFRSTMRRTLIDESDEDNPIFERHYKQLILISLAMGAIVTKELSPKQLNKYCVDILSSNMTPSAKVDIFKSIKEEQLDELTLRYPETANEMYELMLNYLN